MTPLLLAAAELPTTVAGLLGFGCITLGGVVKLLWKKLEAAQDALVVQQKEHLATLTRERREHDDERAALLERVLPLATQMLGVLDEAGQAMTAMAAVTLTPAEVAGVRRALDRAAKR